MQSDPTGPRLPRSAPYDALVPVVDAVLAAAGYQRALYDQHGTARVSGFHLSPAWHAVLTVTHRPAPDGPADNANALDAHVRLYHAVLAAHPQLAQMQITLRTSGTPSVGLTGWPADSLVPGP